METEQARQAVDDLREELRSLREYSAASRTEATAALETASAARAAGSGGERRIEELRKEVAAVLATIQEFKAGFEESRQAAIAARRDAEQARAAAETVGTQNQATTERFTEVWRDILNHGPDAPVKVPPPIKPPPRKRAPKKEPVVEREPRTGFDDSPHPMAILGLDGRFAQLNPPFTRLVGYNEHEFGKAVWPSVHDRKTYREQYDQLQELASGKLETVKLQSTYMHGQGLMVPIVGELTVIRDEAGKPDHLLLVAEDRQTS
jgi:PAS domain S-box-containing protein